MSTPGTIEGKTFRDKIYTIDKKGKRLWVYAQKPFGKFYNYRSLLSYIYLIIFLTLPLLKFNGNPLFKLDVINGEISLFGVIFWPQDFIIFGIGMMTFIIFIVVFTVVYGRMFCGYACPQTVFLEFIFRPIEWLVEGNPNKQKALAESKWTAEKIVKKAIKHILFFAVSFLIANTFLAYIIGVDKLMKIASEPIYEHVGGYIGITIFSFVFYIVFAYVREIVCTVICPYGRLQSVLLDKDTVLVAYDYKRGEPRGKFSKESNENLGDCIDCMQCVKVCPTGIDIRNGTQLECVNCTACIDACAHIMKSINRPKGLIRYASENNIAQGQPFKFTKRVKAYTVVLGILLGALATLLITRSDIDATLMRTPGQLFQEQPNGKISNLYLIRMINKTHNAVPYHLVLENMNGEIRPVGHTLDSLKPDAKSEQEFFVIINKNEIKNVKTKLKIGLYQGDKKLKTLQTNFLGYLQ